MSSTDALPPAASPQPVAARPFLLWQSFARFISSQNPFYLLSVAFVLHGTKLWYKPGDGAFEPWPLMGVIGGYIMLLALTGFVLVRVWRVWDDARSILLMLPLLFVELSLTFDTVLVSEPTTGRALLLIGLALSMIVSEALLVGLKIRLPVLFRVPYHLFLGLLFLYPLIITAAPKGGQTTAWLIFGFSTAAALVLLTLLPAVRRGKAYVRENGTPWAWPLFPWSLFVFLTVCVGMRAYALALSFDIVLSQDYAAAMRMESAFGGYFLVPFVLAIGVLLLEASVASQSRWMERFGLALPVLCLALSIPDRTPSVPYAEFLAEFITRLGSPLWITVYLAVAFYGYAWARRIRFASQALLVALLIAAFVDRRTVSITTLAELQAWPFWIAALWQGIVAVARRDSRPGLIAALCGIVALRANLAPDQHWLYRNVVPLHVAALACLGLGAICRDPFARYLRKAGIPLLATAALTAAIGPIELPSRFPEWGVPMYLATIVAITFGYAYAVRSPSYFFAGLANGIIALARLLFDLSQQLAQLLAWQGAGYFVVGLCWFALAVLISAAKAGALRRFLVLIPRKRAASSDHSI